jgi:hypothetical protein
MRTANGPIGRRRTADAPSREADGGVRSAPALAGAPMNCPATGPRRTRASPLRTAARRSRLTLWAGVRVRDGGVHRATCTASTICRAFIGRDGPLRTWTAASSQELGMATGLAVVISVVATCFGFMTGTVLYRFPVAVSVIYRRRCTARTASRSVPTCVLAGIHPPRPRYLGATRASRWRATCPLRSLTRRGESHCDPRCRVRRHRAARALCLPACRAEVGQTPQRSAGGYPSGS